MAALSHATGTRPGTNERIFECLYSSVEHRDELMVFVPGQNLAEKEKNFVLAITAMAGAVSFARTLTDPAVKEKVLNTVREQLLTSM